MGEWVARAEADCKLVRKRSSAATQAAKRSMDGTDRRTREGDRLTGCGGHHGGWTGLDGCVWTQFVVLFRRTAEFLAAHPAIQRASSLARQALEGPCQAQLNSPGDWGTC